MANPYIHGDRIEQVLAWHAHRDPARTALEFGQQRITYGELMARANGAAEVLTGLGVGRGNLVPLVTARSPELVYGALGVLRAGAAYVLIDPSWPSSRIRTLVDQLAARIVLVDRPDRMAPLRGDGRLGVPITRLARPAKPRATTPTDATGTDTACVYFTSGSTGTPKGILSPHRGTIRTLVGSQVLRLDAETATLQAASLSWDAMSLELWGGLLNGGRCVLLKGLSLDPGAIRTAIGRHRVNTLWLTASLFARIVDTALDDLAYMRLVMTGGERISLPHARSFIRAHPDIALVNGYGPGEATIFTTAHRIGPDDVGPDAAQVPIGKPIACTEVLLIDSDLRPVPTGTPGEIAIAGDGLAAGYLNNDHETRRRFVNVQRPDGTTGRFYRSGDLAVADADGCLWFKGRLDRQIKLAGVRIEPGEVETTIERHPAIRRCAVLPAPGPELIAVYTSVHDAPVDAEDLRTHAAEHLVAAMVPARFQHVDHIPTTATGKIDYRSISTLMDEQPGAA
jgi:mycobactin peptide synthetase MbtE